MVLELKDNRKGVVEIQFNWIFIAFVGAVIIIFFVAMGFKFKSNAEIEQTFSTSDKLETIFVSASVAPQSSAKINLPRQKMQFDCDINECTSQGCLSSFKLFSPGGEAVSREISKLTVYAPQEIDGEQVTILTLPWQYPFTITNFVYVIPENYLFYLHGSNPELNELASLLQDYNISYNIIYDNEDVYPPKGSKAIVITTNQALLGQISNGAVYEVNNGIIRTSSYVTEYFEVNTLLGAIVSEDKNNYECNTKKAIIRFNYVQELYNQRAKELDKDIGNLNELCSYNLGVISTLDINSVLSSHKSNINGIKSTFEGMNQQLLRRSCPPIY